MAASQEQCAELQHPDYDIKSVSYRRHPYRRITLRNGLNAHLISDSSTTESTVELHIHIGVTHGPSDIPGLAHLCEHLIYRHRVEQDNFHEYITCHGGTYDAITSDNDIIFQFEIKADKFIDALRYFAELFDAIPELITDSIEPEVNVIDSDLTSYWTDDEHRSLQSIKLSANQDHSFSKSAVGNKRILYTTPEKRGTLKKDVKKRLMEFYKIYYSSNIISLYVYGQEDLDFLQMLVADCFSLIQNRYTAFPEWPKRLCKPHHLCTKWYIVPMQNRDDLRIIFPLPSLWDYYQCKSVCYICYLLGYNGSGSLLSALKAKNWCNSLKCEKGTFTRGSNYIKIIVTLTKEGINHVDDIVLLMFQYIRLLKNHRPNLQIFNIYQYIERLKSYTTYNNDASLYTRSNVKAVEKYPGGIGEFIRLNYDCEWEEKVKVLIASTIKYLTPRNIIIYVSSRTFENIADRSERWYRVKCKQEKIPKETLDMWKNADFNLELHLLFDNAFISRNYIIDNTIKEFCDCPVRKEDREFVKFWFKAKPGHMPIANMFFEFFSSFANKDPIYHNLNNMFVELVQYAITECKHDAELACITCSFNSCRYGVTLFISGFKEKQSLLLEEILKKMINLQTYYDRFEDLKEKYIDHLNSYETQRLNDLATSYLETIITNQMWTNEELLRAMAYVTIDRLQQYISQFLSQIYVECLISGNIIFDEALSRVQLLESILKEKRTSVQCLPVLKKDMIMYRDIKLDNEHAFRFEKLNIFHKSSGLLVYYQNPGLSKKFNVFLYLIAEIVSNFFSNVLRYKNPLDCTIDCTVIRMYRTQGLAITATVHEYGTQSVEEYIDSFMESISGEISTMSEENFRKYKKIVEVHPKICYTNELRSYFGNDRLWEAIASQQYYDEYSIKKHYLSEITLNQLCKFYHEMVLGKFRCKLLIHVKSIKSTQKGKKLRFEETKIKKEKEFCRDIKIINNILSFKNSQSLYPIRQSYPDEKFENHMYGKCVLL